MGFTCCVYASIQNRRLQKYKNMKIGTLLTLLFIDWYASCTILEITQSLACAISTPKVYQTKRPDQVYTNQLGVIILNIIRDYFKYKSTFTSNVPVDVIIFLIQLDTGQYEETGEDNIPYANIIVEMQKKVKCQGVSFIFH